MNILAFNACLLIAWALLSAGVYGVFGAGWAMIASGCALVALCVLACLLVGGIYAGNLPPGGDS